MEQKSLKVSPKTWKRLKSIKDNQGLRSIDFIIDKALDKLEDDGDGRG